MKREYYFVVYDVYDLDEPIDNIYREIIKSSMNKTM